jgi:NADP-dependent 3-hydroxy acid dehydrogenase YdfG
MTRLDGKIAVITGASSGIGEATVEALAAEGASVVVAARRKDRLDDLVKRIEGNGSKALAVACDVTDEEQAHGLIRRAREEFGGGWISPSTTLALCSPQRSSKDSLESGVRCSM